MGAVGQDQTDTGRRTRSRRDLLLERRIGLALRRAREAQGLSREEMAQRLGLSAAQVRTLEEATTVIPAARLHAAARSLGLTVGDLFPPDQAPPAAPSPMDHPQSRRLVEAYYAVPADVRACFSALLHSLVRR